MLRSGTIAARNCGSVAEWLKAAVLKTADGKLSVSSNLTASAIYIDAKAPIFGALAFLQVAIPADVVSDRFRSLIGRFRNFRSVGRGDDPADAAIYGLRDALSVCPTASTRAQDRRFRWRTSCGQGGFRLSYSRRFAASTRVVLEGETDRQGYEVLCLLATGGSCHVTSW